jgi:hypothetical protein
MRHATRCVRNLALAAFAAALVLQLGGCGGGTTLADGGIVGTGDSGFAIQGEITALGTHSIVVNGQTFSTTGPTIMINGQGAPDTGLMVGMVVTILNVLHSDGTTTVTSIDYHAEVQGVVTGVDSTARVFTALGQSVQTNAQTLYVAGSFDTLVNQVVEVSGFRSTPGMVLATLVIIKPNANPATAPLQVTGAVSSLDTAMRTFSIGQQPIDYSGLAPAAVPSGLANGVTARVGGTQTSVIGTVFANAMTIVPATPPNISRVEIEGLVTEFASLGNFKVNGQTTDGRSAVIEEGTPDMIINGALIEVEGNLVDGVLVANKIDIEHAPMVTIDGVVQAVDGAAGLVQIGGQIVRSTTGTQYIDSSAAALVNFSLMVVKPGDRLSILAYQSQSGLIATRIERLNTDAPPPSAPPTSIQGTISSFVSSSSFVVAGQQVNARSATFVGGSAANLANGVLVVVVGTVSNGTLTASQVQFLPGGPGGGSVTISGTISSFVSVSNFTVSGQRVDASSASFSNGNAGNLANGRNVSVQGTIQGGVLVAQSVVFAQAPPTTLDIQGTISSFSGISSFVVSGQIVNAAQATFSGGSASGLANGVRVDVKGPLQSGVLIATSVQILSGGGGQEAEVHGLITNFVSISNFTVAGRVIDATNAHFDDGNASKLANGASVEVHGSLNGAGVLVASEVEFDD